MVSIEGLKESLEFFIFTFAELAILFVGISFLVGLINEFLPKEKVKKWLSSRGGRGYFIGAILGGLTPFCSCSTIPFTVGLLRAKAGFGPTMAFLFTSPLVNPIIIPLFLTLLGPEVTLIYGTVAIGMVVTISYFLEKLGFERFIKREMFFGEQPDMQVADQQNCCDTKTENLQVVPLQPVMQCCPTDKGQGGSAAVSQSIGLPMYDNSPGRGRRIFNEAVSQFRSLLPFIILGVAIGSILHGFLPEDLVVKLAGPDNPLAVPVSAFVGIPLYLRVSTMVPIAATLIAKGMSTGAVVALIIGGAGASLPELAMLKGLFKTQLLLAFISSVFLLAITAGLTINYYHFISLAQ